MTERDEAGRHQQETQMASLQKRPPIEDVNLVMLSVSIHGMWSTSPTQSYSLTFHAQSRLHWNKP